MDWIYRNKFLFIFICLTPVSVIAAILVSGGGHNETPFLLLFPWGMIGTLWGSSFSLFFLGLGQFPIYGALLDRYSKAFQYIIAILIAQHVALAALFIYLNDINWLH